MTIGTRIVNARKKKGFTQEYVAQMLDVSRQAVSKWEKDISSPDTNNLIALAKLLDVSVEYLAIGTAPEIPDSPVDAPNLSHGFRVGSLICLALMAVCYMIGLFSGVYTDMVQIPLRSGSRFGIPFLMYGHSPAAIALVIVSIVCAILMILLLILANYTDKHKK